MAIGAPFNTTTFNSSGDPKRSFAALLYRVPAHQTPEGMRREQEYYEALGRFVQIFAEAEQVAAQTLWAYAKTERAIATVIFGGTRIEQGSDYLKHLIRLGVVPSERVADLQAVLSQLSTINKVRNHLLHYGTEGIAEGKGVVSDAWRAKAQPTEFPISVDVLGKMQGDLRKIIAHLGYRHLGRPWPKAANNVELLEQTLQRAWQYKHPSPSKGKRQATGRTKGSSARG